MRYHKPGSSQIAMQTGEFYIAARLQIESFTQLFAGVKTPKLLDYLGENKTSYAERKQRRGESP